MNALPQIQDPKIKTACAIAKAGNKARLARLLGIARSSVQEWGDTVPAYQAYRLLQVFPDLKN